MCLLHPYHTRCCLIVLIYDNWHLFNQISNYTSIRRSSYKHLFEYFSNEVVEEINDMSYPFIYQIVGNGKGVTYNGQ